MSSSAVPRLSDQMLPQMVARFRRCSKDPDLGGTLTGKAMASFGTYTGWEIFHAFIVERLPAGSYLFAGTGPAWSDLATALQAPESPVRIRGFVDPRASRGDFLGCPVILAAEAARPGHPAVIACSPALAADLLKAGVPASRIHDIQCMDGFQAFHDALLKQVAQRVLEAIRAGRPRVDHVILVPNGDLWMVVEESVLREVLPPERTIRLYYGPPGRMEASPWYPTYDMGQCLPLVLRILDALGPVSVFARGSAQFKSAHLPAAVKASLPGLFLTFEVYDYASMLEDVFLETWGYPPGLAEDVRDAEGYLGATADFILDKTPGAGWTKAAAEALAAPRVSYTPTLGIRCPEPAPAPPRTPGPFRILCAGSMPHFKNYRKGEGFPLWAYQDIIEPIRLLALENDFFIDIFNASHDPRLDHWPAFRGYATLFDPGRVAYHPRIPLGEVLERAPTYDFGMFLFAASTVTIDCPLQQSLPNRCMSYIAANLPLLVNREMSHLATLVERFQAGITLASTEVADLPGRIRAADLPALGRGARELHRHLVDGNRAALHAFRRRLSEHQDRIRQL